MVEKSSIGISRRSFLKGAGVAGAGAIAVNVTDTSSAHDRFRIRFANPRVREAAKVWKRGYRGRPDRTVALDDTGIDVRHPDLAPWNGVTAVARETDGHNRVPDIHLAGVDALEAWDQGGNRSRSRPKPHRRRSSARGRPSRARKRRSHRSPRRRERTSSSSTRSCPGTPRTRSCP